MKNGTEFVHFGSGESLTQSVTHSVIHSLGESGECEEKSFSAGRPSKGEEHLSLRANGESEAKLDRGKKEKNFSSLSQQLNPVDK